MHRTVLIGVIKSKRDLEILKKKKWYRIPAVFAPKKEADYIAFYQPSAFGKAGGIIQYFGKAKGYEIVKRKELLPEEADHPNVNEDYYKINFSRILKLKEPVRNENKMRVSFGFTTLKKLKSAEDITELFDVIPVESIIGFILENNRVMFSREHTFLLSNGKRYRLDFAIFCRKGFLNIECDSFKWHSIKKQKIKDKERDIALRANGWTVLRLKEKDIAGNIGGCFKKIKNEIAKLNGTVNFKRE